MAHIINLNIKESSYKFGSECTLKDYINIRGNFINYGKWLEKEKLKDTILNYEKFLSEKTSLL